MLHAPLPSVTIPELPVWQALEHLPIWDSITCERLATQLAAGYFLQILPSSIDSIDSNVVLVELLADGYQGFLAKSDLEKLQPMAADFTYSTPKISAELIQARLPQVLEYINHAMVQPHCYLWGGTVPPSYDCSGLMQAAFHSIGVNLPRDAYQQEAFCESVPLVQIQMGDLVFFGNPQKATHVGICTAYDVSNQLITYIHSSGIEYGHNRIATSFLVNYPQRLTEPPNTIMDAALLGSKIFAPEVNDRVSHWYGSQLRGVGRVTSSWQRYLTLKEP